MTEKTQEFEIKLLFPRDRLKDIENFLISKGGLRRQRLQAAYIDTDDFLLARSGIACRIRKEGRSWVQTLKVSTGHALERLEHNVPISHTGSGLPPWDLKRHQHHDAGKVLHKLLEKSNASDLKVRHETDIYRRAALVNARGAKLEYALDVGFVKALHSDGSELKSEVCEIEIELVSGDKNAVLAHAKNLIRKYKAYLDTRSKAQRGFNLATGIQYAPPLKTKALKLDAFDDATIITQVLHSCVNQVLVNASEINTGLVNFDEHLHQLRVGLRRLKTAMKFMALRQIFFTETDLRVLDQFFGQLGAYRDLNFLDEKLLPALLAAKAPPMKLASVADLPHPDSSIQSQEVQLFFVSVLGIIVQAEKNHENQKYLKPLILKELDKIHKDTKKTASQFLSVIDEERHNLRKKLKRLRYALEFFKDLCHGGRYKEFLRKLEKVADALGQYNDICVALEKVETLIEQDRNVFFAQGWLKAEQARVLELSNKELKSFYADKKAW